MARRNKKRKNARATELQAQDEMVEWPPGEWSADQKNFALRMVTPDKNGCLPSPSSCVLMVKPGHSNPWQCAARWLKLPHVRAFIDEFNASLIREKRFCRAAAFDRYMNLLDEAQAEIDRQKAAVFECPTKDGVVTTGIGNPVPAMNTAVKLVQEMLKLIGQDEPHKIEVSGGDEPIKVIGGLSDEEADVIRRRFLGIER